MGIVNQFVNILVRTPYGRSFVPDKTLAEAWKKYPDLPPHSQGPSDGLEGHIAALKEAVAKAKAIGEQRRQVIEVARERIYGMAVEIVALSMQLAEESAANDKLLQQAVLDGEGAIEEAKFDAHTGNGRPSSAGPDGPKPNVV